MKSFQALRQAIEPAGVKAVAYDLRVSTSLVYKWCSDPGEERDDPTAQGARNPLDRVVQICESAKSRLPVEWLCGRVGGYFVESPDDEPESPDAAYLRNTQELVGRFSRLLDVLSTSIANEGRIDPNEANEIRREWQNLQSHGEAFVRACESGSFDPDR